MPALAQDIFTLMALTSTIQRRAYLAQQSVDTIIMFLHNVENMRFNHLTPELLLLLIPPPNHALSPDTQSLDLGREE